MAPHRRSAGYCLVNGGGDSSELWVNRAVFTFAAVSQRLGVAVKSHQSSKHLVIHNKLLSWVEARQFLRALTPTMLREKRSQPAALSSFPLWGGKNKVEPLFFPHVSASLCGWNRLFVLVHSKYLDVSTLSPAELSHFASNKWLRLRTNRRNSGDGLHVYERPKRKDDNSSNKMWWSRRKAAIEACVTDDLSVSGPLCAAPLRRRASRRGAPTCSGIRLQTLQPASKADEWEDSVSVPAADTSAGFWLVLHVRIIW